MFLIGFDGWIAYRIRRDFRSVRHWWAEALKLASRSVVGLPGRDGVNT